jgi:uncharacterized protein (DUF924 family)
MDDAWVDEVLSFWFGELGPGDWFRKDEALDRRIAGRFLALHEKVRVQAPGRLAESGEQARAAIIVLDQFPRNIFRGRPEAFASDATALAVSRIALDKGHDKGLGKPQRQFLYMPFMHSESLADQERSVALFASLGDESVLGFAVAHRDIIARFGRFPHRNAILGRTTTPEEAEFMKTHPGF